ncbi:cathepsin O isoform X2 [Takifugu flavidus]|uniref:cathepsin O isoform X2 n=1 Tax=Takifugu flavidus TaxID=433684 RepID=UPI0025443BD7|nr:cathepsin O isoform X2 [Takifugu flavidus]
MTAGALVLLLLLPSALGWTPFGQDVSASDTWVKVNSSASDFEWFRERFGRNYEVNSPQFDRRLFFFQESTTRHAYLNSFSAALQSAKYGINQFSDLSQREFQDLYLRASADRAPAFSGQKAKGLPAKFDWRDHAIVAPVQNQQATRVKLVPQSEYPYKAQTRMCHFFSGSHGGVGVKNFTALGFSGQEEAMMGHLVKHGPLSVVVDALSWQDYLGGIIQYHCSSKRSNHAVLVVGYDTTGDIPYWIVQNSWGTTWGDKGYVYIKVGSNICGIADSVAAVFL